MINRSPTNALNFDVPESVWTQKPVIYSYLKTFGCATYAHQNIGKLEPKCVFLGYAKNDKGYRLWVYGEKGYWVIVRRDVVFNESCMPCFEGKKDNLIDNDVQIEVEPPKLDNTNYVPLETENTDVDLNGTDAELTKLEHNDNPVLPPDEY